MKERLSLVEIPGSPDPRLRYVRSPTVLSAVGVNLLLLWGATLGGWSMFALFAVVWFENELIFALTALRMLLARPGQLQAWGQKVGGLIVCAVAYVYFPLWQAGVIHTVFSGSAPVVKFWESAPMAVVEAAFIAEALDQLPVLAGIVAFRLVPFFAYVLKGAYRSADPVALATAPIPRMILLHLSLVVCGESAMHLGTALPAVIVLLLLKMTWEVLTALESQATGFAR